MGKSMVVGIALAALLLGGCAVGISGSVRLVDANNEPVPEAKLDGIVVNLINTTSAVENASASVKTDEKGNFKTDSKQEVKPGTYKIEASEAGYLPVSKTIEVKDSSREVELVLKQLPRGRTHSYRGPSSDRDQIINPGEVNIQPPSM